MKVMGYDLTPLGSYVRFYVTVVTQLESVWGAIGSAHADVRAGLEPFGKPLAALASAPLAAALAEPPSPPVALASLWKPKDLQGLSGLNDLYEVAGRFSFQGDDNENVASVQVLVSAARNELHALRTRLQDLAKLPDAARSAAARLSSDVGRAADARRSERSQAFGPLAQTLQLRAKQTVDAVRAVPTPDLNDVDSAADEYRKYVAKVDQVYQTCLPFLRKAVSSLFGFVGSDAPPSWPDSLPLVRELPPELLAVPPADSHELKQARGGVLALDEEEIQLNRLRDEISSNIARLEGEIAAHMTKDNEARGEMGTAVAISEYAAACDQLEAVRRGIASSEQQKAARMQVYSDVWQRQKQVQQAIVAIEEELGNRAAEIAVLEQEVGQLQQREPVLFGKDEWRGRVSGLEGDIEAARLAYTQRIGVLNQLKIDLSALSVQLQTEQSQGELIDRWIADGKGKQAALEKQTREMEAKLGQARPGRPMTAAEGRELLAAHQGRRNELTERIERLRAEVRRRQEEGQQVTARFKQIEVERQRVKGMVDSAQIAATQGRDAALRQLAAQRRSAVERHTSEVLGGLEKSLASVEAVFIEPAREAMERMDTPTELPSATVRENAENLVPVVEALARELEPALLAQDAMLGQIQREFCDVALDACKNAWG
jgi:hypothetical protein